MRSAEVRVERVGLGGVRLGEGEGRMVRPNSFSERGVGWVEGGWAIVVVFLWGGLLWVGGGMLLLRGLKDGLVAVAGGGVVCVAEDGG